MPLWLEEGETTCCLLRSLKKSWVSDPSGVAWEVFQTTRRQARSDGGGPEYADGRLAATADRMGWNGLFARRPRPPPHQSELLAAWGVFERYLSSWVPLRSRAGIG